MEIDRKTTKNLIKIAAFILILAFLLNHLNGVGMAVSYVLALLSPFLVGGMIAFVMNVPLTVIEAKLLAGIKKKNLRRMIAILLSFFAVVFLITLVMGLVVPEIAATIENFIREFPSRMEQMQLWLEAIIRDNSQINVYIDEVLENWETYLMDFLKNLDVKSAGWLQTMTGAISGTLGIVLNFFMGLVFSIYILMQKEKLALQSRKFASAILEETFQNKMFSVLKLTSDNFQKFITGQCLEAVILGCIFFAAMSIFRMPYALTISVLIALMSLIPIFGSFIGCAAGAFLIVFANPLQALIFVAMFLVIQQIEGNLIYPHVVGNSVGLPSIWVFVAVILGGKLFGIVGMLIFIPLCSVIYTLLREWMYRRIKIRKLGKEEKSSKAEKASKQ